MNGATTFWQHVSLLVGGVIAIAVGYTDARLGTRLSSGVDVGLVIGGLAALGVKATGAIG